MLFKAVNLQTPPFIGDATDIQIVADFDLIYAAVDAGNLPMLHSYHPKTSRWFWNNAT